MHNFGNMPKVRPLRQTPRNKWSALLLLLLLVSTAVAYILLEVVSFPILNNKDHDAAVSSWEGSTLHVVHLESAVVSLNRTIGMGSLLTLTLVGDDGSRTPVARSYDGYNWERAGGSFAAMLDEWECSPATNVCSTSLPQGNYVLQSYNDSNSPLDDMAKVARFLEAASFGATSNDLLSWDDTFASYVQKQQLVEKPTFHREYFRRRMHARWRFHKPEFAAALDPCATGSTWRRHVFTEKDHRGNFAVRQKYYGDMWEILSNGYVLTVVANLRFANEKRWMNDTIKAGQSYAICSTYDDIKYENIRVRNEKGQCRSLLREDFLMVDFPNGYEPHLSLDGLLPALNDTLSWERISERHKEFRLRVPLPREFCSSVPADLDYNAPLFAKTLSGEWLIHDPRIILEENSVESPLGDGGARSFASNKTHYCSTVARNFQNEDHCYMADVEACAPGWEASEVAAGVVICGSPGEVANDYTLPGSWQDMGSLSPYRSNVLKLPRDTSPGIVRNRQREQIWSQIVLSSSDQLRQRMAWALSQIFALPKQQVASEQLVTEPFLNYYDIFVRHAFGNYRDVLQEITYSPLMAESLSYRNSRSVNSMYGRTKTVVFPDENYARELMQLFTIGLIKRRIDGTPILNAKNKTIRTYTSENIESFARVWTGFIPQPKRANAEGVQFVNRVDPLRILPQWRDKFPKTDLYGGYLGDGYPLCTDVPEKSFLQVGAKYRLLGMFPRPETYIGYNNWNNLANMKHANLEKGRSGLYEELCRSTTPNSECAFPGVVRLPSSLVCLSATQGIECEVESLRVVQVEGVFYEHIPSPCVEHTFFPQGRKLSYRSGSINSSCGNPSLPVAATACCATNTTKIAQPSCLYAGERVSLKTAEMRCELENKVPCNYARLEKNETCPLSGYQWTTEACSIRAKIQPNGMIAVVYNIPGASIGGGLSETNPTFFRAYWDGKKFPTAATGCASEHCYEANEQCICDVEVSTKAAFLTLPPKAVDIKQRLRIGHIGPTLTQEMKTYQNYRYFSSVPVESDCCDENTVFEVRGANGRSTFLRNVESTVSVKGSNFSFLNPVQFHSLIRSENSITQAEAESNALLDSLFYHPNTAPFVAHRFLQRFGISNPSPRVTSVVATAFRTGRYEQDGVVFGTKNYGDLAATSAACLLDAETRSVILDFDPVHGSLKEPILKVMSFMRALDFNSTVALVDLDLSTCIHGTNSVFLTPVVDISHVTQTVDQKIGQMAHEQKSVFSFFRPEYAPPGPVSAASLVAPEAEVMSSGRIVGLLNGLYTLVDSGLNKCDGGFGSNCNVNSTGFLNLKSLDGSDLTKESLIDELSSRLMGGRLSDKRKNTILQSVPDHAGIQSRTVFETFLKYMVATPEFHSTSRMESQHSEEYAEVIETVSSPQSPEPSNTDIYKAVIHLSLLGGCDSYNVLMPGNDCGNLSEQYNTVRDTIALTNVSVIAGDTSDQPCKSFGLHEELSYIGELYNSSDLLFLANVGVLSEPVDRTNYNLLTETQLFAHPAMVDEVADLDPYNSAVGTGALGRMADVLQGRGHQTGRTAVESTPQSLAGKSSAVPPIVTLDQAGISMLHYEGDSEQVLRKLNTANETGLYGNVWSDLLVRALDQTDQLYDILANTPTQIHVADSNLAKRLKIIANLIAGRTERGVDRDFFYVSLSGFDTHSNVNENLNLQFGQLNSALRSFVAELKSLGVWDDVVIVQTSEFARTLTPNTGGGSDHGWGGNYWMAGGSVKGNRVIGKYPSSFLPDSDLDVGRGRILPTTAWECVFNSVAEWMGATGKEELDSVLPNRGSFPNLFKLTDLFIS